VAYSQVTTRSAANADANRAAAKKTKAALKTVLLSEEVVSRKYTPSR
jgi:hypothetical protein